MADTLLHITLADEIARHPQLSRQIHTLYNGYRDDFHIGSVLFDLPYYDTILLSGIETLLRKPVQYHPFGETIHTHQCRDTCIRFIVSAVGNAEFAIACGLLTHFAVDLVFHREIEQLIGAKARTHDSLEREIGIHCHRQLLGHSGAGTPYAHNATFLFPHDKWHSFAATVFNASFASTLSAETFQKWQRSLRVFGMLYSRPWFPWLTTHTTGDNELAALSLSLMENAAQLAVFLLNAAASLRNGEINTGELTEMLPRSRMSDGLEE